MLQLYLSEVDSEEEKSLIEFLYTNYKQLMYKTAFSILHNKSDAEDAVHEAFLRVVKNISKFSEFSCNENVSYLVITVRGIALDMLEKKGKIVRLPDNIPSLENVEDIAEASLTYEQALKNIEKLTPVLKNIATLKWGYNLSDREISELLDMTINAVRVSVSRARAILLKMNNGEE